MNELPKKNWNEIKSNDSWALFKIMSEFVHGYEKLSAIGPCISIFGSARTPSDHPTYHLTVAIAKAIAASGYGIISGGGPGIMEAANKTMTLLLVIFRPTMISKTGSWVRSMLAGIWQVIGARRSPLIVSLRMDGKWELISR